MRTYLILFFFAILVYFAYRSKKQIENFLASYGILDYFNYSRPWTKEEQERIKNLGNQQYRNERDRMVAKGIWKFPSINCANLIAKKYKLSEFQRDALAAYDTFPKISERLKMLTNGKINLSDVEISNICGGKL